MPYRYQNSLAAGLKPDPLITYTEWAKQKFELPKESAAEYGRYRSSRTPFVEEILGELSPMSRTQVIIVIKTTQCAATTIALIFMCGSAALYPGTGLFMQPTDAMCRSYSKKRFVPAIRLVPDLKEKIKEPKSRNSGNTILQKEFPGGSWMLSGANAGASYRSESIKYLILDDFDAFEIDIEGEGSPEELADRRTGTFPNRKIYINSTTTDKEASNIERAVDKSSQGYFHVPCPHCGYYQYFRWVDKGVDFGIKFERDEKGIVIDTWYQCECCRNRIEEHEKTWMFDNYKYVHKHPERKVRGFKWNGLHTPLGWVNSWKYIAEKFLEAQKELREGKPEKYKTWLNTFMCKPWEEPGDRIEWVGLQARCEPYGILTVPMGGLFLTCGVDTQDDRLEVKIIAWGRGEECWIIYKDVIMGDPEYPEVWKQIDMLLNQSYIHESGVPLKIDYMAIDSQGHRTQAVYNFCRKRRARGVIAIQGSSKPGAPVIGKPSLQDMTWKGKKIKKGVQLWTVGTEIVKSSLMARLNMTEKGPGYIHFPMAFAEDDEYFKQITGEKLVTVFKKGVAKKEWKKTHPRVEMLDCFVYAYSAAVLRGLSRMTDSGWDQLEQMILGAKDQTESAPKPKKKVVVKSKFMGS